MAARGWRATAVDILLLLNLELLRHVLLQLQLFQVAGLTGQVGGAWDALQKLLEGTLGVGACKGPRAQLPQVAHEIVDTKGPLHVQHMSRYGCNKMPKTVMN